MESHSKESLENEFADVLFSLLILAKNMDVDVENAVNTKMIKIRKRFDL